MTKVRPAWRDVIWEMLTWGAIIVATVLIVSLSPWYVAENLLRYILGIAFAIALFWYLKSRRLYFESRQKTRELKQKQLEISQSHKAIDLIFDNSADGILILDHEQKIASFSPGLEKITGFTIKEALGKSAKELLHFKGDAENSLLPDAMFLPRGLNRDPYIKNSLLTKEGREIDIESSSTLIQEPGAKPKALAIIRDVTYENDLVRRDKEFIAITSHQLNTPLSIIQGYASLLTAGKAGKIEPKQKDYLGEILTATKRMIALVDSLLSITRIEQDKIKLEKSEINIAGLISELKNNFEASASEKKLSLKFESPDSKLLIFADKTKLAQALSNLIDNGLKYTEHGSVSLKVTNHQETVDFVVKDTGMGISPTDLGKVGQKFYRSETAITVDNQGTGLGLFIAKTIAEKHGGSLTIQSDLRHGSTFIISLPKKGVT